MSVSRAELGDCKEELACPAKEHSRICPWHPDNVQSLQLTDRDFEQLLADLDGPPKPNPRLTELMKEEPRFTQLSEKELAEVDILMGLVHAPVTMSTRMMALSMRYNFDRLQLMARELERRLKEHEE